MPTRRWKDNIKLNPNETGREVVEEIHLDQDRIQCGLLRTFRLHKRRGISWPNEWVIYTVVMGLLSTAMPGNRRGIAVRVAELEWHLSKPSNCLHEPQRGPQGHNTWFTSTDLHPH